MLHSLRVGGDLMAVPQQIIGGGHTDNPGTEHENLHSDLSPLNKRRPEVTERRPGAQAFSVAGLRAAWPDPVWLVDWIGERP